MSIALDLTGLERGTPVGLAVSGGGDSMALLHLAAQALDQPLHIVSVDHGLRDVRAELQLVADAAQRLGLSHDVLRWDGTGQGSLQTRARAARRALIAQWATERGIRQVMLGHTHDDQAETVLMRLARGSGVDGLAAMAVESRATGLRWLRPLLGVHRGDLRTYLREIGADWAEDPSNADPRHDRVRARQMMAHLKDLGLSAERLVQLADHASAARLSLDAAARAWVRDNARQEVGQLWLAADVLNLERDTHRRVLAGAVQWMGRSAYRPVWSAVKAAAQTLRAGGSTTLGGAMMRVEDDQVQIARELAATPQKMPWHDGVEWDGWRITGPTRPGLHIAPLDSGAAQISNWRAQGLWRPAAISTPAIWENGRLIAAPALESGAYTAVVCLDFVDSFN